MHCGAVAVAGVQRAIFCRRGQQFFLTSITGGVAVLGVKCSFMSAFLFQIARAMSCRHILLRGARKNRPCGRKCAQNSDQYCSAHLKRYTTSALALTDKDGATVQSTPSVRSPTSHKTSDVDPQFEQAFLNNLRMLKAFVDPLVARVRQR